MVRELLKIYTDNGKGDLNPTFHDIELSEYTYTATRMGMPQLTATLNYPSCLDKEWTGREYVTLRNERYYIRHVPTSKKDNTSRMYQHSLVFRSERDELLTSTYFYDVVRDYSSTKDKPSSNSTDFSFYGTISEFVDRLNCAFRYAGIGDSALESKTSLTYADGVAGDGYCAILDTRGDYDYDKVAELQFSDKFLWDAITEAYEKYEIQFEFRGKKVIFGAREKTVDHTFKYGHDNELLSIEKTNANAKVVNRITMVGSSENIPHYYPNETEYGHITIFANTRNKVLTSDKITIENMTQLLSRLNADSDAVFGKYNGVDVGNAQTLIIGYSANFEGTAPAAYIPKQELRHDPTSGPANIPWHIRVLFDVTVAGYVEVNKILGNTWIQNTSRPTEDGDLTDGVKLEGLRTTEDLSQGIASIDYSSQLTRNDSGKISLGFLPQGTYIFQFSINIVNRKGGQNNPVVSFCKLSSVGLGPAEKQKTGYYWQVGDTKYDGVGSLGISIAPSVSLDAIVGDKFRWKAQNRLPFQTNLMPPKYRDTKGEERFYNAIAEPNLLKQSNVLINGYTYNMGGYQWDSKPAEGVQCYLTICAKVSDEDNAIGIYLGGGNSTQIGMFTSHEEKIETFPFVVDNYNGSGSNYISFFHLPNDGVFDSEGYIKWAVVTIGDIPVTEWIPSESDPEYSAYVDSETEERFEFPNPYVKGAPNEYIYRNEDIKPTIEGIENASGQLLGEIAAIAFDEDDNDSLKPDSESGDKNDSLKYEHSYFYIKLNVFDGDYGFDLFAHASQTDAMTIQMVSGDCNGCKFKIQALEYTDKNGLKSFKNPVQTDAVTGDIAEGGYSEKVKKEWQEWQQDSRMREIWICVQKDANTFGTIIPNNTHNYMPKVGDKFNIINIDLPQPYILAAEKRLEQAGMKYMSENNEEKFTFSISASRIFFAENPDVLASLDEYSKIQIEYNDYLYNLYVSSFEIRCKNNEVLPEVVLQLTDTISVGQSFLQSVTAQAAKMVSGSSSVAGTATADIERILSIAEERFLSKVRADITPFKLKSGSGFEVGDFVSGGTGGIFFQDPETGQTYIEADKLKIRMKAIFEELEIAKVSTIGGKFIITQGGGLTISYVEEYSDKFRCYFKAKDEDKGASCRLVPGDQVQCHEFNIQAGTTQEASNHYYWRLVTEVNNDESYIELSKTDCDNSMGMTSDAPRAGDTIVQLGSRVQNQNQKGRQSAIILSTYDAYAPCVTLYDGINSYSLAGKSVVEYGVDKSKATPEPFFNCYGRFFFGPRTRESYLEFNPADKQLTFKGNLSMESTVDGTDETLDDYLSDNLGNYMLSLSLQSAAVTINADGSVPNPLPLIQTSARVMKNGVVQSGWTFTKYDEGASSTLAQSGNSATLTVDSVSPSYGDNQIFIVAQKGDITINALFKITFVRNGADGIAPTIYFLDPNPAEIRQTTSGAMNPTTVKCSLYSQTGNERTSHTSLPNGFSLRYTVETATQNFVTNNARLNTSYQVLNQAQGVIWELIFKNEVVASAHVPVIPDITSYKSYFENNEQELTSIKAKQNSIETDVSTISQKADSIELTVGKDGGYVNLLDNTGPVRLNNDGTANFRVPVNWAVADCITVAPLDSSWSEMWYDSQNRLRYSPLVPNPTPGVQTKMIFSCAVPVRLCIAYFGRRGYLGKMVYWINANPTATITLPAYWFIEDRPVYDCQITGFGLTISYPDNRNMALTDINTIKPMIEVGDVAHAYTDRGTGLNGSGILIDANKILLRSDDIIINGTLTLQGLLLKRNVTLNTTDLTYYTDEFGWVDLRLLRASNLTFRGSGSFTLNLPYYTGPDQIVTRMSRTLEFVGLELTLEVRNTGGMYINCILQRSSAGSSLPSSMISVHYPANSLVHLKCAITRSLFPSNATMGGSPLDYPLIAWEELGVYGLA